MYTLSKACISRCLFGEFSIKWIVLPAVFLLLSVSGVEGKTYQITIVAEGGLFEIGQRFLEEAYRRIGMDVEFVKMPGERALVSSNMGVTDGEIFRVDGIDKQYTNLIKIPTSFISAETVVFTKRLKFHVDGYDSLRPYIISFRRGLKIAEMKMDKFPNVKPVPETKHAFLMLGEGRVEGVLEERITGHSYVDKLKLKNIKVLEPPVSHMPLFHYIHKNNRDLVPKLDAVFKEMIQEGALSKIIERYKR